MGPLTSVTTVEEKELWSYTQPSTQGSVSRSLMLGKVPFRWRSCHWGRKKRRHFSGLRFESSGMEILRRVSSLRVPVPLAESVSLSRMWTQQRWPGTAAVKFSNRIWGYTTRLEIQRKTIWRIWNLPRPPTWSRRSWKAIELSSDPQGEAKWLFREVQREKKFPFTMSHTKCVLTLISVLAQSALSHLHSKAMEAISPACLGIRSVTVFFKVTEKYFAEMLPANDKTV